MLVTHGNVMRARGFTLIEALVVLSIAAIVLAIGAPNLSHLIASMNARSASFDLIADLALARSEAIKRNAPVSVVPLVVGNWSQGWRVTAGAATLRQREALPPALSVISAANNGLQFEPNGRIGADTATANATWAITSSNATPRCVVITPTGAARSKVGATC
jgi:type IV fimbrial biogenesis protein FimT